MTLQNHAHPSLILHILSALSLLNPSEFVGEYCLVVMICCHSLCQCVSYPFLKKTSVLDTSSAEFPKNILLQEF